MSSLLFRRFPPNLWVKSIAPQSYRDDRRMVRGCREKGAALRDQDPRPSRPFPEHSSL